MAKQTISERAREPVCPQCGGPVKRKSAKGPSPRFCCAQHQKAFQNRMLSEGLIIAPLAKAWRINRGSGPVAQEALQQLCQVLDFFNNRDLEKGRPRADLYAAKLMGDHRIYLDRRRIDMKGSNDAECND